MVYNASLDDLVVNVSIVEALSNLKVNITDITVQQPEKRKKQKRTKDDHYKQVREIILSMRIENITFQKIAENLENQKIPTFTCRGKWHAQTVHRLYEDY